MEVSATAVEIPYVTLDDVTLTALPTAGDNPASASGTGTGTGTLLSNSSELHCQNGQIQVELSWSFAKEQKTVDLDIRFGMRFTIFYSIKNLDKSNDTRLVTTMLSFSCYYFSAVAFSSVGNLEEAVFYNQLSAHNGAMNHSGDLSSGGEVVTLKLDDLLGVAAIIFVLSAYKCGTLRDCESASVTVKDDIGNVIHSLMVGGLGGDSTGLLMAVVFKHPGKTCAFSPFIKKRKMFTLFP